MNAILLIDFGSTYTKLTAVDMNEAKVLGTAQAYTTVETDINDGLAAALHLLEKETGPLSYVHTYACSSAAGGLRIIGAGLVPELTSEAAKLASLGAGGKILKIYSFELTGDDLEEIRLARPDIFLLVGGTDGGNTDCILHNASMLASLHPTFPIIVAGNRSVGRECERLLREAGAEVFLCANVMPTFGVLHIEEVQAKIREVFLRNIIKAKGLTRAAELLSDIMMPTPSAVLTAMKLLADGTKSQQGIGELIGVDVGGATTDVYSIAAGKPSRLATVVKGLQEPYAKRTVEGDLGMRYSIRGVRDAVGSQRLAELAGLPEDKVDAAIDYLATHTDTIPDKGSDLASVDYAVASLAVETAVARHAGTLESTYTLQGLTYIQQGKDLSQVKQIIVTGGSLIRTEKTVQIASHALYNPAQPMSLRPLHAQIRVDRRYIIAAMGLLSLHHPDIALTIMKKEMQTNGSSQ